MAQAKQAEADLATANRLAHGAQARIHAAPEGADTTVDQGAHRRALTAANTARDELAAARRRLSRAMDARDVAAHRAMRLVEDVKDSGDLNDSWWDNWGAKIVKVIVKIANVVAVVAGVLALVVGWIPVIGQALAAILGTIALAASLVSLLGNIALAATKSMLGTANPMTRQAARAAAQRSLEQGFVPAARSIGQSFRAMPGEFADNLRTLRHADWGDALRQARQAGPPRPMRFFGEHGADANLRDISKIDRAVRGSDEVAPHVHQLQSQQRVFIGAVSYNVYDIGRNIAGFAPSPSAADQLHLSHVHQPVAAGARP